MSQQRQNRRQLYERLVGQTVADRYEIISLMGFGGMGAVYEALQRNMNRRIALKYIPSHDPVTAARFEREALTVSQLRHPNTVTVFDYGQTDDGFLFLSMELLSGRTLTELIKEQSPLSPQRVVHIASQICRSLAEAHEMGIVHRDIKPDNVILIEVDGDPDVTKVLDFGIAKAVSGEDDETLTGDGRIVGTPRYMSPEQILSEEIDHRSDIYSLGCIIFEMLCGAPPFEARSTTALMISHAQDAPPPFAERLSEQALSAIPDGLEQVVRRAMAKSPFERPQNTEELRVELEEALDAHRAGRPAPDFSAPVTSPGRSGPGDGLSPSDSASLGGINPLLLAAVGGTALVVLLMVGALFVFAGDDEEESIDEELALQDDEPAPQAPALEDEEEVELDPPTIVSVSDTIHLRIESDPSGADVIEDDVVIGETPMNLSLAPDERIDQVTLKRRGYRDKDAELDIDVNDSSEQTFSFKLRSSRPARTARPATPPAEEKDDGPSIPLLFGGDDDDDDDDSGPLIPTL